MAKKKLEGIVWPNLPDDTYYLDAEKVEYSEDETYPSGSVGKALSEKAKTDGYYSNLTAGSAEQLLSTVTIEDEVPYQFRTSGGANDIGDRETDMLVGGTVAWNQLVNFSSQSVQGGITRSAVDTKGKVTFTGTRTEAGWKSWANINYTANHKMLVFANDLVYTSPEKSSGLVLLDDYSQTYSFYQNAPYRIFTKTTDTVLRIASGGVADDVFDISGKFQIFDLTQLFGSTIADYIYSLETATAGAGVAWFKKLFNKPYYAYNAGELKSISGLVSHDMTGFNQWDEEWESGMWDLTTGQKLPEGSTIRCKNYIPILPNTTYCWNAPSANVMRFVYFDADKNRIASSSVNSVTTPTNFNTPNGAYFMAFYVGGTTYNNDICINLAWDGERNGEYEPYVKHSYPLDDSLTLRGLPKLDSSNNLYYDGDTYESDGTVTRHWKEVTLNGDSTYTYVYNGDTLSGAVECFINFADKAYGLDNFLSDKFQYIPANNAEGTIAGRNNNGGIVFRLPSTTTKSNDGCKAWFASNPTTLTYELATPTTETAEPYTNPQIVDDFGTEEYVTTSIVPVGHKTQYMPNLRAKLEMAPNSPSGDGDYIVRQTNGQNEYVALGSTSVIENIVARLEALEGQSNG